MAKLADDGWNITYMCMCPELLAVSLRALRALRGLAEAVAVGFVSAAVRLGCIRSTPPPLAVLDSKLAPACVASELGTRHLLGKVFVHLLGLLLCIMGC